MAATKPSNLKLHFARKAAGVRIHDTHTGVGYVAHNLSECRDETDKLVFELVLEHGDTITMGSMVGSQLPVPPERRSSRRRR